MIIHKKGGEGGERLWQASPPLLFQPLLGVAAAADVTPACPAGEGRRAVLQLSILRKALVRLAPSLLWVSSRVDPLSDFCRKHGWLFESPKLSFKVRGDLLQEPRGAGAGSHQLPDAKKLWVAADKRWHPQHHYVGVNRCLTQNDAVEFELLFSHGATQRAGRAVLRSYQAASAVSYQRRSWYFKY